MPCALARASPARTRSWIIERSNSAKTPSMPNIALPAGRRGVEALGVQVEIAARAVQLAEERDQVLQAPAEPVDASRP